MNQKIMRRPTDNQNPNILARFTFILLIGTILISACEPTRPDSVNPTAPSDLANKPVLAQTSTPPGYSDPLSSSIQLPTPDPWDGKSRVTILLLGVDDADWESSDRAGPPRADTIILLTVDPLTKTAGVLSIPRDLWVTLPGFQEPNRINTAYRFGELYDLPGGGPGLSMRTVEHLLGIPVNYYVTIEFTAFVAFIDEIKGVSVDVKEPMTLSLIGTDKNVELEPGRVTLPGDIALAYARSRATESDDFGRSDRQREIILSVRERILRFDMLPTLVLNAPDLYKTVSDGFQTNLSLGQVIRLAWLAQHIPQENIKEAAIGKTELTSEKSPDGQDIFVPIPDRIQTVVNDIFAPTGAGQEMTRQNLILAENSRIQIVNESGQPGLAERTAEFLEQKGLNVVEVIESEEKRPFTRLVDRADDPYTLRFLVDVLKIRPSEIWIELESFGNTDMEIILGEDWALSGILP